MGVIRWLDRIDPARFGQAVEVISATTVGNLSDVESLCEQLGISADEDTLDSFRDALDDGDETLMSISLNGLIETFAAVQTWELDKSLDRGLNRLFNAVPDLRSLADIVDLKGADVDLPACVRNSDSGLFVVWSRAALQPVVFALKQYQDLDSLKQAVEKRSYTFFERLLGKPKKISEAVRSTTSDDYFATHWANMREAILETDRAGHYLGMGMST